MTLRWVLPWDAASTLLRIAAEVRRGGVLAGVDDPAADGAGAGEEVEQRVAVAPADRALKRAQILAETAQHFEHRLLVVQEHVAPHRGIRRRDAREIAEAAGRVFDHLALGDARQI